MPKVSVIIPTYNRCNLVGFAIDSVLSQNFKDFEIIVVDDGSTDNTKQVLGKYASRVNYIYQKNQGRAEAKNAGIRVASGEYIAFLDDDDLWLPDKLEKQVAFLNNHYDIGLVHVFIEVCNEQGSLLLDATKKNLKLYKKAIKLGYTYEGMSRLCIMFTSTVMLRKGCFDKAGLFDRDIPAFEDWDLYLRIALYYHIGIIQETLVKYRIHQRQSVKADFVQGRIHTILKHLDLVRANNNLKGSNKIVGNFYTHLAQAYYIGGDYKVSRRYILKILKFNPFLLLFNSWFFPHLASALLPLRLRNLLCIKKGS